MTAQVSLGAFEFQGAMAGIGGMTQFLSTLRSSAAPALGSWSFSTRAGGAFSLSAGDALGGIAMHTGTAGAINVTIPTAPQLVSAWPGARIGATAVMLYGNLNSATDTIIVTPGDTSVTLVGTTAIGTGTMRLFFWELVACPVGIIGMSYDDGIVTIQTGASHGLAVGGTAVVANIPNTGFVGSFTVTAVLNSDQLSYALDPSVAFATNQMIPNVTSQSPGLLNTPATANLRGCLAWSIVA